MTPLTTLYACVGRTPNGDWTYRLYTRQGWVL
jgi:hypothetical protein